MRKEKRYTETEWCDIMDLRANWDKFCDADAFDGSDTFTERMEERGYIHLRRVTRRDMEEISFPAERGIEPGGNLWELTVKGRNAIDPRASRQSQPSSSGGGQ